MYYKTLNTSWATVDQSESLISFEKQLSYVMLQTRKSAILKVLFSFFDTMILYTPWSDSKKEQKKITSICLGQNTRSGTAELDGWR